ncbi:hypothetical protein THASP1DRAFT_31202 [Thamnocephalis sphaerospora]|uniref:Uncharacterized protein n=1 Tax=Thamnocephalis sphaerospora TaxID=78915 RepID=A0A4P9XMB6_9FUNG|nr:hypothetical protein THASP1DRAFT_31202 [Thamnocephalis sphaerospora]|eukprot:RKP06992.1 hypothetical protein THASP1DRAFT_31202 [Thamnocephalis sphaerospora]
MTFTMRLVSPLGITAAVTLAALALVGSSANAAVAPPSSPRPAAPEPLSSEAIILPREYTDFRQFSKLFTLQPHFAVFQPEGARLRYENDEKGRTSIIKAVDNKNGVVSEISAKDITSDSANIIPYYNADTGMANEYKIFTPRGGLHVNPRNYMHMEFNWPYVRSELPSNLQPWDGKKIQLVPAPGATNV